MSFFRVTGSSPKATVPLSAIRAGVEALTKNSTAAIPDSVPPEVRQSWDRLRASVVGELIAGPASPVVPESAPSSAEVKGSRQLGPVQRAQALDRMKTGERFDVVIVGGGVTGTYAALDAASRGLKVALVEAADLASGTSSRSSGLFHGGYRYQKRGNMRLVHEASAERNRSTLKLAPHLSAPQPLLYPLSGGWRERLQVGAKMVVYDNIGGLKGLPKHRHLSAEAAREALPAMKPDSLSGAIQFYEAKVDDARYTVGIARTAAEHGAAIATSTEVTGLIQEHGEVKGVQVRDRESGDTFPVFGRTVVSATGVWSDDLQKMAGTRGDFSIRASKGIHALVPRDRITGDKGMFLQTEKSVFFAVPLDTHWVLGTNDVDWKVEDKAHPAANQTDKEYILAQLNPHLEKPLTLEDIEGVYSGLRPLLADNSTDTARTSRKYAISEPVKNFFVIAGGKLTTARAMGRSVIDAATANFEEAVPPSQTRRLALVGAENFESLVAQKEELARQHGLTVEQVDALLHRHGSEVERIFDLLSDPITAHLRDPVPGAEQYLLAELHIGASQEGALHLDDVLTRRTNISTTTGDRGWKAAEAAAAVMGPVLNWDEATTRREVQLYRKRVEQELKAETTRTDEAASQVRLEAPDPRG